MTGHAIKVLWDHTASCTCGWSLTCLDARTATREAWTHVKAARPVEDDEEVPF